MSVLGMAFGTGCDGQIDYQPAASQLPVSQL
jgi:hypothetical protein